MSDFHFINHFDGLMVQWIYHPSTNGNDKYNSQLAVWLNSDGPLLDPGNEPIREHFEDTPGWWETILKDGFFNVIYAINAKKDISEMKMLFEEMKKRCPDYDM